MVCLAVNSTGKWSNEGMKVISRFDQNLFTMSGVGASSTIRGCYYLGVPSKRPSEEGRGRGGGGLLVAQSLCGHRGSQFRSFCSMQFPWFVVSFPPISSSLSVLGCLSHSAIRIRNPQRQDPPFFGPFWPTDHPASREPRIQPVQHTRLLG
jgi:hypothetical protein